MLFVTRCDRLGNEAGQGARGLVQRAISVGIRSLFNGNREYKCPGLGVKDQGEWGRRQRDSRRRCYSVGHCCRQPAA